MKCSFDRKGKKECDLKCEYFHTCTRSEYQKKEGNENGNKKNS